MYWAASASQVVCWFVCKTSQQQSERLAVSYRNGGDTWSETTRADCSGSSVSILATVGPGTLGKETRAPSFGLGVEGSRRERTLNESAESDITDVREL